MTDAARDWAAPERAVLDAARDRLDRREPAVLATVVAVEGRAYRRPGAKALVTPDAGVGTVTAGCLTDALTSLADEALADGPRLERFDLRDGEEWGLGVGCEGVVDVLLEPLGERHRPLLSAAGDSEGGTTAAVVLDSRDDRLAVGDRAYDGADDWPAPVRAALQEGPGVVVAETDRGRVEAFVERGDPGPHLLVVGSGADVGPVVDLARRVDFRVTVAGFRGARATAERFPAADRVVATSPRDLTDAVRVDPDTYAVVMTHNFVDDRLAVEALLETPAPYVGVMGPDDRFDRLREAVDGLDGTDRVYAPVGLDLGGGTPHQVALSVVSEALAAANGRSGGHLRAGDRPVHDRG